MLKKTSHTAYLCALLLVSAVCANAQTENLTPGRVVDESGSLISGAVVTLVPVPANPVERRTFAATDGTFELPASFSGFLIVEAPGFRRYERLHDPSATPLVIVLRPELTATVNITGSATRIDETAASVIALNRAALDASAAATTDDKLRQVPGFSLFRRAGSRTANPTTAGVSLRGVGASGASRALVLLDGIPLNDPFGGWIYWGRVPGESIAQIEVLRGSSSDLYGSSAIGGVVSLIPRDASADPLVSLEASYGTQNTPFASVFASAGRDKWIGSVGAEAFITNGFIPVADEQRGAVDSEAGVKRWAANPRLDWRHSDNFSVFAAAGFYSEVRTNGTPLQNNDTRLRSYSAGGDVSGNKFGILRLRAYGGPQLYHQSFSAVTPNRSSESLTRLQTAPSRVIGFSARWTANFGTRNSFTAGLEGRRVRGRSDETAFASGRATSEVSAGGTEVTIGAYAGVTAPLASRFTFSGGVRIDRWQETAGFTSTRSLASGQVTSRSFAGRNESAVSPRASILYKVREALSLSASFSTGFRQPTLNELYRSFRVGDVLTLANESLRSERAKNYEAGAFTTLVGGRLYLRGSAFCTVLSDPVTNLTLAVTPTLITRLRQNLGKTRSCGFEADGQYRLSDEISLSGGYLFVDSRVNDFPPDRSLEDLRVPQIPKHQVTFQFQYANPRTVNAGLQFRAGSSQFDDDRNRFPLRGYATVDGFISRRITRHIAIFSAVENLFDTEVQSGRTPVLTLAAPRSLRFGIRIR